MTEYIKKQYITTAKVVYNGFNGIISFNLEQYCSVTPIYILTKNIRKHAEVSFPVPLEVIKPRIKLSSITVLLVALIM